MAKIPVSMWVTLNCDTRACIHYQRRGRHHVPCRSGWLLSLRAGVRGGGTTTVPSRPRPDPDDDKDDEDEEPEEDLSGLNTTDHYAYIAGYEDGTVRPDGNITRAEVATIFFR